jgi:hypothetical protein
MEQWFKLIASLLFTYIIMEFTISPMMKIINKFKFNKVNTIIIMTWLVFIIVFALVDILTISMK